MIQYFAPLVTVKFYSSCLINSAWQVFCLLNLLSLFSGRVVPQIFGDLFFWLLHAHFYNWNSLLEFHHNSAASLERRRVGDLTSADNSSLPFSWILSHGPLGYAASFLNDFHISEPVSVLRRILSSSFDCSIGFIDLLYTSFSWLQSPFSVHFETEVIFFYYIVFAVLVDL